MDNDRKVNLWKFVHDKFHELAVMRAERVAKEDEILNENEEANRLRELIQLIRDIIENKPEYRELPEPTSGYM